MTEILTTDAILTPGGVAPWYGQRSTSFLSASLEPGVIGTYEGAFARRAFLVAIASNYPAWIRFYDTAQARTADLSRQLGIGMPNGMGLMAEVATTAQRLSVRMSPIPLFDNGDTPRARVLYMSIMNRDTVAREILTTIFNLPVED